jgi:hypothetical protein
MSKPTLVLEAEKKQIFREIPLSDIERHPTLGFSIQPEFKTWQTSLMLLFPPSLRHFSNCFSQAFTD